MKYTNVSSQEWQIAADYATSLGYEIGKHDWWCAIRYSLLLRK